MQRRGFLGWLLGLAGFGAAALAEEPPDSYVMDRLAGVAALKPTIRGVGVLRHPSFVYDLGDGTRKTAVEMAYELAKNIHPGSIIALPSDRDMDGNYLWDFRIEGGDFDQVRVGRGEVEDGEGI